jgi:hypothetical protein
MLRFLQFLLILGGAVLLVANIEPYIAVTGLVFGTATGANVCRQLTGIAFLGGILSWGCGLIASTISSLSGFLVWATFQTLELLPIANRFNIPFLSNLVNKLEASKQIETTEGDRAAVKTAKERHNSVIERSLQALLTFSWLTYFVDLALMSWLYKPLNEIGELNFTGLVRVLLGVFGVEVVVLGCTLINNLLDPTRIPYRTAAKKPVIEY